MNIQALHNWISRWLHSHIARQNEESIQDTARSKHEKSGEAAKDKAILFHCHLT